MNLVQLKYLKAVAAAGSFSLAARNSNVSQPTISNAIAELESELGSKIFKRSTRCVELTPFGFGILGLVEQILALVEDIEEKAEARLRPERRLVRVAFSPIIDGPRLMRLFESFGNTQDNLSFTYKECGLDELESRLSQEKIDVICGIRIQDRPQLSRRLLYWDTLRFIPKGGLKESQGIETVSLEEIARTPLILTVETCGLAPALRDLFRRHRISYTEYSGHPMSYHVVQEWANQGLGGAILPESRIIGNAQAYPVIQSRGRPVTLAVEAVWLNGNHPPDHIKAFTLFLKESLKRPLEQEISKPAHEQRTVHHWGRRQSDLKPPGIGQPASPTSTM